MMSFDLENVDPRSQNLHQKELLCWPPLKFGASSSSGSQDNRGALYAHPPSRVRHSQILSSVRVKGQVFFL